jgi:PAS domain S-box-containing protein
VTNHCWKSIIILIISVIIIPVTMAEDSFTDEMVFPVISLTELEKKWLETNREIILGVDPGFAPFEYIDENGEYQGIASDYVAIINRIFGLNMKVKPGLQWSEVIDASKKREIDVLPCVGITDERMEYLTYSKPYITFYRAIITRSDHGFISGLVDVDRERVAVQKNSSHHGWLRENSSIEPILFETFNDAMAAVSTGKADACIGNVTVAAYSISKSGLSNLKIAAPVSSDNFTLHFAVRKDWPELAGLINKGLDAISSEQVISINNNWIPVTIDSRFDWVTFWRVLAILLAIMIAVIATILVWNRKLSDEIRLRLLIESELRKLTTAVDQSASSIIITDKRGLITYVNPRFVELTGYSREEALGRNPRFLKSDTKSDSEYTSLWKTITSGDIWKGDFYNRRKDGSYYWESATISPVKKPDGTITSYIAVKDDITNRIMMEKALKESNRELEESRQTLSGLLEEVTLARTEAEQASRYKSEFLANMSHDIRTPLSAIIGLAELLLDTENDEGRSQKLKLIKESGDNLLVIINDILDLSKIEAGKISIENRSFSIRELLKSIHETYSFKAEESGLELNLEITDKTPDLYDGDKNRLNQIVTNLVGNALKFTKIGSVDIKCHGDDEHLVVAIEDTGIGIPPQKLDLIFKAFEQADPSTTREYGGTGLGLSISSRLARLMNGRIDVSSRLNRGSTFTVTLHLPSSRDKAIGADQQLSQVTEAKSTTDPSLLQILLAEDTAVNQMIIEEMLSRAGFHCKTVENGEEALNALERRRFDLLLLDMHMPVKDGETVVREIRESGKMDDLVIIALTANAQKNDRKRYMELGCNDYISKPIDRARLEKTLGEYLEKIHGGKSND